MQRFVTGDCGDEAFTAVGPTHAHYVHSTVDIDFAYLCGSRGGAHAEVRLTRQPCENFVPAPSMVLRRLWLDEAVDIGLAEGWPLIDYGETVGALAPSADRVVWVVVDFGVFWQACRFE